MKKFVTFLIAVALVAVLVEALVAVFSKAPSTDIMTPPAATQALAQEHPKKDSGTRSIAGVVIYKDEMPQKEQLVVDKDLEVCGHEAKYSEQLLVSEEKQIQNVVVYIEKITGGKDWSKSEYALDQKGCTFIPHVLVVPKDTEVQINNSDKVMHNIHSYSLKNTPFNEGIPADGKTLIKKFKFTENFKIGCDAHKWMSSWIVVRDNPYYAITDKDGNFKIEGIPDGKYKLVAWHELLGKQVKEIELKKGETLKVDFEFEKKK